MLILANLFSFLILLSFPSAENVEEEWALVWSDEFNYSGAPDSLKWNYDLGDACNLGCGCGWGNNELEYYTKESKNVIVKDGNLVITAIKEKKVNSDYTSTRLVTKGKAAWQYGKIEARLKLPSGKGTWPAFWMLPEENVYGGWPKSGEIDIMEHVGYEPTKLYGTVHTQAFNHGIGTQVGDNMVVSDMEDEFHIYGIEWTENKIDFYCDNEVYFTFKKQSEKSAEWPFNQQFHLLINLAVGGNWGGSQGIDEHIWPQQLLVDYVRVYQKKTKN